MSDAIAIIPARGGSRRIPRKNIRDFAGKPAIGWPLETAVASGLFARVVVTTDDAEIAGVARRFGAEVPFVRDADLADDHTGTTDVVRDAVARLALPPDTLVCCIYPTALFVRGDDLQRGLDAVAGGATWAMTAAEYATPIDRAYRVEGGRLIPRNPAMMTKRSQDLEPAFLDAGQFYWARAGTWRDPDARVWDGAAPVLLPLERVVDIDTEADWRMAERLFSATQGEG